jgi:hypothetical protein
MLAFAKLLACHSNAGWICVPLGWGRSEMQWDVYLLFRSIDGSFVAMTSENLMVSKASKSGLILQVLPLACHPEE